MKLKFPVNSYLLWFSVFSFPAKCKCCASEFWKLKPKRNSVLKKSYFLNNIPDQKSCQVQMILTYRIQTDLDNINCAAGIYENLVADWTVYKKAFLLEATFDQRKSRKSSPSYKKHKNKQKVFGMYPDHPKWSPVPTTSHVSSLDAGRKFL